MYDGFSAALKILPLSIRQRAAELPEHRRADCEEFRLRLGRPATVLGTWGESPISGAIVGTYELSSLVELATGASPQSFAAELSRGFITAAEGVRVGLCGTAIMRDGEVRGLRSFCSASVRIPRQAFGCADTVLERLLRNGTQSTLVISPPGYGKTTLLRELARSMSERGLRIGIADERCEIAAADSGTPRFELGPCADVISGAPKAEAAMMLLRSMNPEVLIMDEITDRRDADVCESCAGCAVALFASVHGSEPDELKKRPAMNALLEKGVFRYAVVIRKDSGARSYEALSL